jgi:tetratricopeptide (TPR) repeat protein
MRRTNDRSRTIAGFCTLLGAVALSGLGGCAGQGQHNQEFAEQATKRMDQLKSGTQWSLAQQQFLAGDFTKALRSVDGSIALNAEVPKAHLLRGRILTEMGRLEPARESFLEAERLASVGEEHGAEHAQAEYYLGVLHERFNEPQKAYERYTKALELDPTNAQPLVAAAEMLVQMDRLDEAESLLEKSRTTFEYNAAIRQSLGQIAMLKNDPAKAAEYFNQATILAPGEATIGEDLVRAQMQCGRFGEAEMNLRRMIESAERAKDEPRRDLLHMRARCLMAMNRQIEARDVLLKLTGDTEGSADVPAWLALSEVSAALNDLGRLRTASSRVIALAPDRPEGYLFHAVWNERTGKTSAALVDVNQALVRGESAEAYALKGIILKDLGRVRESAAALQRAAELDPTNADLAQLSRQVSTSLAQTVDKDQ